MTNSVFDPVQCWMMANVASRMDDDIRLIFWEILPDMVPDLTAHLPALTESVRKETNPEVLEKLSFHPLPTTLSPEAMNWRAGLATAWEKRLLAAREKIDRKCNVYDIYKKIVYISEYTYSLRGLTKVDGCGTVSETTCPSALPTLVNEAHHVQKSFTATASTNLSPNPLHPLECLSALADWRPGPNVMTDPATLNKWREIWWELYQEGIPDLPDKKDTVLVKGIAARALLNLLEAGSEEETGIPAGMETVLLESLTMAVDVAGETPANHSCLRLLKWEPQDITRFPIDRLAELPKTLLKRFKLAWQSPGGWRYLEERNTLNTTLQELSRWNQAGLLAICRLDLFRGIVPHVIDCVDETLRQHFSIAYLLNRRFCRWLVRKEVAAVKEGTELLQKLEKLWQGECQLKYSRPTSRRIAWEGRIELQRAGLATETPATFQKEILEAIKNEKSPEVRLILSFWKPGKDGPDEMWRTWEREWQKALKSRKKAISQTAALALLRPDLSDNALARRQKLQDVLWKLPNPELSVAELACLMGELPVGNPNVDSTAAPNRRWQFRPDEMRFRVPTEPVASASTTSTPATVQPAAPDRRAQGTAERVQSGGCHG